MKERKKDKTWVKDVVVLFVFIAMLFSFFWINNMTQESNLKKIRFLVYENENLKKELKELRYKELEKQNIKLEARRDKNEK